MWSENRFIDRIIIALVALFAVNFMLQQSILIMAAFAILLVMDGFILYTRRDAIFYLLIVFVTIYILINGRSGIVVLGMPVAYYLGRRLIIDESGSNLKKLYLILAFSMAIHVVLNFIYEYSHFGSSIFVTGVHYDIWSGQTSTATGIMINASLLASIIYYLCFIEKRKAIQFAGISIIIFLGIYNIMMGERSYFFLLAIALISGVVLNIAAVGATIDIFKIIGKIIAFAFIVYLVILFVFRFYGNEINEFFNDSYFYHRFFSENSSSGMLDSTRWQNKIEYLRLIFIYPWGGGKIGDAVGGGSHELWLEALNYGGILCYVIILLYTISSVSRAFKAFSNKRLDLSCRIIILVGMLTINAQFFVEPVIAGSPVLLMSYCMLDGAIKSLLDSFDYDMVYVGERVDLC